MAADPGSCDTEQPGGEQPEEQGPRALGYEEPLWSCSSTQAPGPGWMGLAGLLALVGMRRRRG